MSKKFDDERQPRRKPLASPMKRLGGKGVRYPWVIQHLPPHEGYAEPFGGTGVVLLNKPRSKGLEIFNDLDGLFHNSLSVIRDHPRELTAALAATPYSRAEFLKAIEVLDDWEQRDLPEVELARLHFVVVRQSFSADGGSWSTSTLAGKNQAAIWSHLPEAVARASARLQGVYIERKDYSYVLKRYDHLRMTWYIDPPYAGVEHRYYDVNKGEGFDHRALRAAVEQLAGSVVISYADRPEIRELYAGWRIMEKPVVVHAGSVMRDDTELLMIRASAWATKRMNEKRKQDVFDDEGSPLLL